MNDYMSTRTMNESADLRGFLFNSQPRSAKKKKIIAESLKWNLIRIQKVIHYLHHFNAI